MPTVVFRAEKDDLEADTQALYLNSDIVETPPREDGAFASVSVKGYLGLILLTLFPVVNLVFLVIWASGGAKRIAVKNYAQAALILLFFVTAVFLTLWITFGDFWNILFE